MFRHSFFRGVLAESLPIFSSDLVGLVAEYEEEDLKTLADEKLRQAEDQKQLTNAKMFVWDAEDNYRLALIAAKQGWTTTLSFLIFSKLINPNKHPYPHAFCKTTLLLEACISPESTPETRLLLIKASNSNVMNTIRKRRCHNFDIGGGPTFLEGSAIEHTLKNRDLESVSFLFKRKAKFFHFWDNTYSNHRYLPMDYQTLSLVFLQASSGQIDRILNPMHSVDEERQKYIRDCYTRFLKENELTKILANKIKPFLKDLLRNEPLMGGYRKRFAEILEAVARCFSPELLYMLFRSQIAVFENTSVDVKLLTAMSILDKYWIDPAKIVNRDRAAFYIIRLNAILDTITKEFSVQAPVVLSSTPKPLNYISM